jgi:hypothetical protein
MNNKRKNIKNKKKTQLMIKKRKRKCGIYTQWNFTQLQRRMTFSHWQVNEWNWRTSS